MAVETVLSRPDLQDYQDAQRAKQLAPKDPDNVVVGPWWKPEIEDPEARNAWSSRFTDTLQFDSPRIGWIVAGFGHTQVVRLAEVLQRRSSVDVTMGAILESTPQPAIGLLDVTKQEMVKPQGLTLDEALKDPQSETVISLLEK